MRCHGFTIHLSMQWWEFGFSWLQTFFAVLDPNIWLSGSRYSEKSLKGHWQVKSVSNKHLEGCLRPAIWAANIFKNFLILYLNYTIFNYQPYDVKMCLPVAPDRRLIHLQSGAVSVIDKLFSSGRRPHTTKIGCGHTGNDSKIWTPSRANSKKIFTLRGRF
jgi:hypothetical protein